MHFSFYLKKISRGDLNLTSVAFEIKPIIFGFSDKMDVRPCSKNVFTIFCLGNSERVKEQKVNRRQMSTQALHAILIASR